MAISLTNTNPQVYIGLSTDTKPSAANPGATFYETDTDDKYEWDGNSWVKTKTSGAMHVSQNGTVTAVNGTLNTYILAPDDADAADVITERYDDATGVKAFRIIPHTPAVALFEGIIFAWSTTAGDLTALNTIMAAVDGSLVTPDGIAHANAGLILPSVVGATPTGGDNWHGDLDWIIWDGTTRIKTIAVRSSGANHDAGVALQVIV